MLKRFYWYSILSALVRPVSRIPNLELVRDVPVLVYLNVKNCVKTFRIKNDKSITQVEYFVKSKYA